MLLKRLKLNLDFSDLLHKSLILKNKTLIMGANQFQLLNSLLFPWISLSKNNWTVWPFLNPVFDRNFYQDKWFHSGWSCVNHVYLVDNEIFGKLIFSCAFRHSKKNHIKRIAWFGKSELMTKNMQSKFGGTIVVRFCCCCCCVFIQIAFCVWIGSIEFKNSFVCMERNASLS